MSPSLDLQGEFVIRFAVERLGIKMKVSLTVFFFLLLLIFLPRKKRDYTTEGLLAKIIDILLLSCLLKT